MFLLDKNVKYSPRIGVVASNTYSIAIVPYLYLYAPRRMPMILRSMVCQRWLWSLLSLLLMLSLPQLGSAQGSGSVSGKFYQDINGNGRVDPEDGPLSGASVIAAPKDENVSPYSGYTNSKGEYKIAGLPNGRYYVGASAQPTQRVTLPESGGREVNVRGAEVKNLDFAAQEGCADIVVKKVLCDTKTPGCYWLSVEITNQSSFPMQNLYFLDSSWIYSDPGGTTSDNHVLLPTALPPGATTTIDLKVCFTGQGTGEDFDVESDMTVHDPNMDRCCAAVIRFFTPKCDCFQILEQTATCLVPTEWTINLTLQSLWSSSMIRTLLIGEPMVGNTDVGSISPTSFHNVNLNFGQTAFLPLTIKSNVGSLEGKQVCVKITMLDVYGRNCCSMVVCIDLPMCGCEQVPGKCLSVTPPIVYQPQKNVFGGGGFNAGSTAAFVTCASNLNDGAPMEYVVAAYPLGSYQTQAGTANYPINGDRITTTMMSNASGAPPYHGPGLPATHSLRGVGDKHPEAWTQRILGTVFGLTHDKRGNTYVTHFGLYPVRNMIGRVVEQVPGMPVNTGFGCVIRLRGVDGMPEVIAYLPNRQGTANGAQPGLGNITYDYDHDLLWVTNFEDGRIYRIPATAPALPNATTTAWSGAFPATVPHGEPIWGPGEGNGMAPLGSRKWGIQYHEGRIYYCAWNENGGRASTTTDPNSPSGLVDNEIRSVAVSPTFPHDLLFPSTDQVEYYLPQRTTKSGSIVTFAGTSTPIPAWTNPVSDISVAGTCPPGARPGLDGRISLSELSVADYPFGPITSPNFQTNAYNPAVPNTNPAGMRITPHASFALELFCDKDGSWAANPGYSLGQGGRESAGGTDYDYNTRSVPWTPNSSLGARLFYTGYYLNADWSSPSTAWQNSVYGFAGFAPYAGNTWMTSSTGGIGQAADTLLVDLDDAPHTGNLWWTAKSMYGDIEIPCPPNAGKKAG